MRQDMNQLTVEREPLMHGYAWLNLAGANGRKLELESHPSSRTTRKEVNTYPVMFGQLESKQSGFELKIEMEIGVPAPEEEHNLNQIQFKDIDSESNSNQLLNPPRQITRRQRCQVHRWMKYRRMKSHWKIQQPCSGKNTGDRNGVQGRKGRMNQGYPLRVVGELMRTAGSQEAVLYMDTSRAAKDELEAGRMILQSTNMQDNREVRIQESGGGVSGWDAQLRPMQKSGLQPCFPHRDASCARPGKGIHEGEETQPSKSGHSGRMNEYAHSRETSSKFRELGMGVSKWRRPTQCHKELQPETKPAHCQTSVCDTGTTYINKESFELIENSGEVDVKPMAIWTTYSNGFTEIGTPPQQA
ncbi:hypothetical protein C8R46DRAFT_1029319 [Mycena filopes]|nr:hypothetical protein C8R46DRAFT_1029319 [Mycena filopes]